MRIALNVNATFFRITDDAKISRKAHLTEPSKKAHLHQVSFSALDKSPYTRTSREPEDVICGK